MQAPQKSENCKTFNCNFKYFINPMHRILGKITVNTEQQLQDIWPMD